jgi:hypothetical protein
VNVAVADAPFAPMTVIVCAPAVAAVGMTKPELMSIPPFVFMQVKPTGVVAVITVESKYTVIVSFALNPEPVIAIVTGLVIDPSLLVVGVISICAAATLNVVDAEFTPSDSDSVYAPGI